MVIYTCTCQYWKRINCEILDEESDRTSPTPPSRLTPPSEQVASPSSGNETQTEHESDNEYVKKCCLDFFCCMDWLFRSSEVDEFNSEQIPIATESNNTQILEQQPCDTTNNDQQTTSDDRDNQSLRIIIKFLNDTRKEISASPNDTISKVKE